MEAMEADPTEAMEVMAVDTVAHTEATEITAVTADPTEAMEVMAVGTVAHMEAMATDVKSELFAI